MTSERLNEQPDPRAIALIVGAFVILGTLYSVTTPIFEASDELTHYPVISHIAAGRGLPIQDPKAGQLWRQEGSQPPLYYALGALFTCWIDTSDLPTLRRLNPHADVGKITLDGNVSMVVHTANEGFPYRGTVLAVHIVRWLSVLMGAVTVWLTYLIAHAVFPSSKEVAFLAAALTAFNPMFLFISGSVNNDNLAIMLCTLALFMILRLDEGRLTVQRLALLGLVIGLAVLSKVSAAGLFPLAGLILLIVSWRARNLWTFLWGGMTLVAMVALVAGWWMVRNWQLYGDWLGLQMLASITGARHPRPNLWQLAGEWQGFVWSFWGLFGGLNVPFARWVYSILNAIALIGGLGLLLFALRWWRRGAPRVRWLRVFTLFIWPVIIFVALLRWTSMTPASQGRLMFPALSSICALMGLGLVQWVPTRLRRPLIGLLAVALFALAILTPFWVIAPAYARPQPLSVAEVGAIPNRLGATFGGQLKLLGYHVDSHTVMPGDKLPVTLYWEALAPMSHDYSVFVHLLGDNDLVLAQRDTYPGRGTLPTTLWKPGEAIADTLVLLVPQSVYAPDKAQIEVGVYDFETGSRLLATSEVGPLGDNVRFQPIDVQSKPGIAVPNPVDFDFEDKLALVGYKLDRRAAAPGEKVRLTLYWQALIRMDSDYTVFAHVLGQEERLWAQKDSQPQNGAAPTSSWQPDTLIEDQYELVLRPDTPPEAYEIEVGLYLPSTGKRLGILGEGGRLAADRVLLTRIRVVGP